MYRQNVYSRGNNRNEDPPRRHRFRGQQYVRRRTPSGGGGLYRTASFSDERNDSSPPSANQRQPVDQQEPSYGQQQPPLYQPTDRQVHRRGQRHYNNNNNQQQNQQQNYHNNDNNSYSRQSRQTSQRNFVEAADNDYDDHQPSNRDSGANSNQVPLRRAVDDLFRSFQNQKTDIEEIKRLFTKLTTELDQVKTRVKELESKALQPQQNHHRQQQQQPQAATTTSASAKEGGDWNEQNEKDKRRKSKILKQREKKAAKLAEKRAAISENASQSDRKILNPEQVNSSAATDKQPNVDSTNSTSNQKNAVNVGENQATASTSKFNNRRTNRDRNNDNRRVRREPKEKPSKPLPKVNRTNVNDDSTTQAAEPSSEDRPEGEDGRETGAKVRVFRRKKPHFGRQGHGNRRRRDHRADSSERNSNDTSPQGDANGTGNEYKDKRKRNTTKTKTYPELSESELNEIVQTLKREFVNLERPLKAIKSTMDSKGPKVVYEFAVSILDHAMCDVTSPTKLSEIASSLYLLLVSEDNTNEVDFQKGFYDALNDISKREDDIAIDAPRYLDTLGQVLADCVTPMHTKHRYLVKKFLNGCLEAYCQQNRAALLASIMKAISGTKNDRFAKEVWDTAQLDWKNFLNDGVDLTEFLEAHDVKFTTQAFSPEPQKQTKNTKEIERFADNITRLVEGNCTSQELEDVIKELDYEPNERIDYFSTLIYAIVRGCLVIDTETDSESEWKLNNDTLNQYSSVLNAKREDQDAIAVSALAALTVLWHQYNCPQDLFRTILLALHNQGTVSYENLKSWLESESLNHIPGIGAARLNSKRYIQDLGASLKA